MNKRTVATNGPVAANKGRGIAIDLLGIERLGSLTRAYGWLANSYLDL